MKKKENQYKTHLIKLNVCESRNLRFIIGNESDYPKFNL